MTASTNPVAINTGSTLTASIDDSTTGDSNIASAEYKVDDGPWTPMGASDGSFDSPTEDVTVALPQYGTASIHTVCVRGTDAADNTSDGAACIQFVVYDPSGGFVTGGGWIDSPAGACKDTAVCLDATGKATFGFNAKYKKGANVPDGNTEFQFHAGNLNFHSTDYQWLVVAGSTAKFKGTGTVNGVDGYTFQINADDGHPDQFRMQIWHHGSGLVYDNGPDEDIGGGLDHRPQLSPGGTE